MSYLKQRLLSLIPLALLVSFVSYGMLEILPGDPVATLLGVNATIPEQRAQIVKELNLDQPFPVRYVKWLGQLFTGDFGLSYINRQPVTTYLKNSLPLSIELVIYAMIIALSVAIPLGILTAYRAGTRFDRMVSTLSFASLSVPGFVLAILAIYLFAVRLSWFPAIGYTPLKDGVFDNLRSLFLPACVLAIGQIASFLRLLRTDMIATLQEDFITMAKAKGLSDRRILLRHALKPSSFTLLTVAGGNFAALLGGALVVEQTFALPGVGRMIVTAIGQRDYLVVLGGILIITLGFLVITTLVDMLYGLLDPRIRHARALA